jgi:hypothetical protein
MNKNTQIISMALLALFVAFGPIGKTAHAQSDIDDFQANCDAHRISTNANSFDSTSHFRKRASLSDYIEPAPNSRGYAALERLSSAIFFLSTSTGAPLNVETSVARSLCGDSKYALLTCPITSCANSLPESLCGVVDTTSEQARSVERVAKLFRLYRKAIKLKMSLGGNSARGHALLKMLPKYQREFSFKPETYAVNVLCARSN